MFSLQSDGLPDNKLYIWDMEQDNVQSFDFKTGQGEQDDDLGPIDDEADVDISDVDRSNSFLTSNYLIQSMPGSI